MTAQPEGLDIESVLAAHAYVPSGARGVSRCACGEQMHGMPHDHRVHVAAALREQIDGALAEAWDEGVHIGYEARQNDEADGVGGNQWWESPNVHTNPHRADLGADEGD